MKTAMFIITSNNRTPQSLNLRHSCLPLHLSHTMAIGVRLFQLGEGGSKGVSEYETSQLYKDILCQFQTIEDFPDSTNKKAKIMAFTSQPAAVAPTEFHTSLMSCCEDTSTCCYGYFCLPCLGCSIASDMNECCCCGLGMPIRSVYRTKYNIQGSMCNDWCVGYFCMSCAACQMKRDIDMRKRTGQF